MRITIDVSAAVEVVMGGKRQEEIVNILNDADWVIAPSLFICEASNALWKYHEYQDYSKEDIMKKMNIFIKWWISLFMLKIFLKKLCHFHAR
jgi:predicted nucleic acid-binding protein